MCARKMGREIQATLSYKERSSLVTPLCVGVRNKRGHTFQEAGGLSFDSNVSAPSGKGELPGHWEIVSWRAQFL
jgi:hypothetical protein